MGKNLCFHNPAQIKLRRDLEYNEIINMRQSKETKLASIFLTTLVVVINNKLVTINHTTIAIQIVFTHKKSK